MNGFFFARPDMEYRTVCFAAMKYEVASLLYGEFNKTWMAPWKLTMAEHWPADAPNRMNFRFTFERPK